jgi:hypothetical protein
MMEASGISTRVLLRSTRPCLVPRTCSSARRAAFEKQKEAHTRRVAERYVRYDKKGALDGATTASPQPREQLCQSIFVTRPQPLVGVRYVFEY